MFSGIDSFLDNWRNMFSRRQEKAQPSKNVDKPVRNAEEEQDMARTFVGTMRNLGNYSPSDIEKLEAADRGTAFTQRPYFHAGEVTVDKYNDFIKNKNLFRSMLVEWGDEEDPTKRIGIMRKYSDRYGFANNPIFADYMKNLGVYDSGEIRSAAEGGNFVGPVSPFTADTRKEWVNYIDEASNEVEKRFSPYRSA